MQCWMYQNRQKIFILIMSNAITTTAMMSEEDFNAMLEGTYVEEQTGSNFYSPAKLKIVMHKDTAKATSLKFGEIFISKYISKDSYVQEAIKEPIIIPILDKVSMIKKNEEFKRIGESTLYTSFDKEDKVYITEDNAEGERNIRAFEGRYELSTHKAFQLFKTLKPEGYGYRNYFFFALDVSSLDQEVQDELDADHGWAPVVIDTGILSYLGESMSFSTPEVTSWKGAISNLGGFNQLKAKGLGLKVVCLEGQNKYFGFEEAVIEDPIHAKNGVIVGAKEWIINKGIQNLSLNTLKRCKNLSTVMTSEQMDALGLEDNATPSVKVDKSTGEVIEEATVVATPVAATPIDSLEAELEAEFNN